MRRQLERKAAEVVAFEEVAGVEDATRQVVDVDAGEAVGGAEVTVRNFVSLMKKMCRGFKGGT